MDKKFKHGDRVYHKNLKQYGFFIGYAWESEEECDVNFETEDGEMEQKHVSVNETVSIPQLSWGNNRCKWR